MAKQVLVIVLFALALPMIFFGDHFQSQSNVPDARDCPYDPQQLYVPAGQFLMGSTWEEREVAYRLDQGGTRAYGWYEKEARTKAKTHGFCIDRYPVTHA